MKSGFEVIHAGILTLIQDSGRFGYNALGVTHSGAIDEYAYSWANKLLDNQDNTNVLEILFSGLTLKANSDCLISLTGANLSFTINDKSYLPWQTFNIKKNDILRFTKTIQGQRAYLAVKDGFLLNKEFGSYSTTLKESLGGLNGSAIKKGDFLSFKESKSLYTQRLQKKYQPNYHESLTLRVILGYQQEAFSKDNKDKFFSNKYLVTQESNRMAVKLKGCEISSILDGIISEGISFGAIQIPKDGQPIVLLKERQTMGGYPKIGSVLAIDCFKLSQLKSNSSVKFEEISLLQAQEKTKEFYSQFK